MQPSPAVHGNDSSSDPCWHLLPLRSQNGSRTLRDWPITFLSAVDLCGCRWSMEGGVSASWIDVWRHNLAVYVRTYIADVSWNRMKSWRLDRNGRRFFEDEEKLVPSSTRFMYRDRSEGITRSDPNPIEPWTSQTSMSVGSSCPTLTSYQSDCLSPTTYD